MDTGSILYLVFGVLGALVVIIGAAVKAGQLISALKGLVTAVNDLRKAIERIEETMANHGQRISALEAKT